MEHGEHRRDLVRRKRKFRPREHGRLFLEDVLRETGMHQALMDGEQDQRLVARGREAYRFAQSLAFLIVICGRDPDRSADANRACGLSFDLPSSED